MKITKQAAIVPIPAVQDMVCAVNVLLTTTEKVNSQLAFFPRKLKNPLIEAFPDY